MSESATTIPETTDAATTNGSGEAKASAAPGDFEHRVRTDPDFAVEYVKTAQRKLSEANARLKPLEPLESVVKATFGADMNAGVQQVISLADKAYRIDATPAWKVAVEKLMAGERVSPTEVSQEEAYLTPEEKELRVVKAELAELRGHINGQDTRLAQGELTTHLTNFFNSDLGKALNQEEKESVVTEIQKQFGQWASTDTGRGVLRNLQPKTIKTLVMARLDEDGKLESVYDRIRQGKEQRRLGAATDSPSSLPTGAATSNREFKNAAEALRAAAKDLMSPEARQRLGW